MLLQQKRKQEDEKSRQNGVEGFFVPKDQRKEMLQTSRMAHFQLGDPSKNGAVASTTQEMYGQTEREPLNAEAVTKNHSTQKSLVLKARNANWSLSSSTRNKSTFYNETSAAQAFTADKFAKRIVPVKHDIHELRKAHFQVGFEKNRQFSTTTALNNAAVSDPTKAGATNSSSQNSNAMEEQRKRVQKNRAPQYELGQFSLDYTSTAQKNFKPLDLSQALQAKKERDSNSMDVRKSHFQFGTDRRQQNAYQPKVGVTNSSSRANTPARNSHQPEGTATNAATRTNIQIYHQGVAAGPLGSTRFTSSYNTATDYGQSVPRKSGQLQTTNELRRANFSLGGHTTNYKSHNQSTMSEHALPNQNNNQKEQLKARMGRTQWAMGSKLDSNMMPSPQSIYSSEIDVQAKRGGLPGDGKDLQTRLKRTNFHIGSSSVTSQKTSEAAQQFQARPSTGRDLGSNSDLKERLRAHNFSLYEQKQGGGVQKYYQTSHNSTFAKDSNQRTARVTIDPKQMADARNAHYQLGFENSFKRQVGTVHRQQVDSRRNTAPAQASTLGQIASAQKTVHITVGGAASNFKATQGDRRTSNQSFYKWIQPKIN